METYVVRLEVVKTYTEVHEVEVEADSTMNAIMTANMEELSKDTLKSKEFPDVPVKGPFKARTIRRLVDG